MQWRVVVSTVLALGVSSGVASAGPWTPARGHGQVIFGWTLYRTGEEFSDARDRESFGNDGEFSKNEINPYFETGITDRLALVGSFFASDQAYHNTFGHLDNHGLGDTELGLRYRLHGDRSAGHRCRSGRHKTGHGEDRRRHRADKRSDRRRGSHSARWIVRAK